MNSLEKSTEKVAGELFDRELWIHLGELILKIFIILVVASIVIRIGRATIRNVFKVRAKSPIRVSERRENTLLKLLENVLTYLIYFIALITILSSLNIDVKGLLAGAGIVGLAVGFGAQSLVRDIISGFFIIFEDQFSVGDYVGVGKFMGTVDEIGLRTTKIKSWTGEVHILPNGNITEVTNYSINNSISVVDINIPYEQNIERAEEIIEELLEGLQDKYEEIINKPELLGVQKLGTSDIQLRIIAETVPMMHWYIARAIRKEVKQTLDQHGIHAPFPKLVMYSRNNEEVGIVKSS
ncbi:mechanosensitive ion channel family protein, partial [Heyndrickxia sporothermodurans]|uniref:mechanosensitive ion channel family protein n=1 Tax=Heyndrickxia sporothermodurans TaxID=46224 RepID=UPI000D336C39